MAAYIMPINSVLGKVSSLWNSSSNLYLSAWSTS